MKDFFSSDYQNKYISPFIQNEIISSYGDTILKKIMREVNESLVYLQVRLQMYVLLNNLEVSK